VRCRLHPEQSHHGDEEHRHEKDCQDGGRQHAANHDGADGILSAGAATSPNRCPGLPLLQRIVSRPAWS
jgi:hypothetical protein